MEEEQKLPSVNGEAAALDVEFLPLVLLHRIHRNLKSSQVEIVPQPHYFHETTPEPEPEIEGEMEPEVQPPVVVYAPPLPAFREKKNWWDFVSPVYAFNNPRIRARVELLMTNRIVHITDRKYMVKLQEKIKEDYAACLKRRMQARAAEEIERQKCLLLAGKITFEQAPVELKSHPVCRINNIAQRIMKRKRVQMKMQDKTWAYRTGLKRIRMMERKLRESMSDKSADRFSETSNIQASVCLVDAEESEDVEKGLMFSQEDYDKLKLEDPLIKLLREIDAVNDMYELADQIIGESV